MKNFSTNLNFLEKMIEDYTNSNQDYSSKSDNYKDWVKETELRKNKS